MAQGGPRKAGKSSLSEGKINLTRQAGPVISGERVEGDLQPVDMPGREGMNRQLVTSRYSRG